MTPRLHLTRLVSFGGVSAIGLAVDFGLTAALLSTGTMPMLANMVGAGVAVSLVYMLSVRRIFRYHGQFLLGLFLAYVAWQLVAVTAASWVIGALAAGGLAPLIAKLAILPATFGANYLMMHLLTTHRTPQP